MGHYKSNLRDIEFNLFEVLGRGDVLGSGPYEAIDADTAREMLKEVSRLAENELAESFQDSDRNPPVYDPQTQAVTMPASFTRSFNAYRDSGFWSIDLNAPIANLPVVIFQFAMSPYEDWQALAWSGALLITAAILLLNITARVFAAWSSFKS